MNRPLKDETLMKLQTEYYRLGRLIDDARRSQEQICVEVMFRVEDAESQIPAPAPE